MCLQYLYITATCFYDATSIWLLNTTVRLCTPSCQFEHISFAVTRAIVRLRLHQLLSGAVIYHVAALHWPILIYATQIPSRTSPATSSGIHALRISCTLIARATLTFISARRLNGDDVQQRSVQLPVKAPIVLTLFSLHNEEVTSLCLYVS